MAEANTNPEDQSASAGGTGGAYEQERRLKREKLRELGVDPYGGRTEGVRALAEIRGLFRAEFGQDGGPVVKAAGRVMLKRDMGKLSFLTLRDESGDLQVALDRKRMDEVGWQVNGLIDLGDLIVVEGALGATKKGEVTVWATGVGMASKALLPPPAKWEGLSDVELRYRQRYVDLWANPEVMRVARLRIRVVEEIRRFLTGRGFVEVETPMMQVQHGGAAARPFVTHHKALDMPLYMRIAPELFLKRLLVGGFSKVFEINRNFRNEGISPRHNPEFTMLEAYEAFGSWETMAELVESMICAVAERVFGTLRIKHASGREINLEGDVSRPVGYRWRRVRMAQLVEERTGWKFDKIRAPEPAVRAAIDAYELRHLHRHAREAIEDSPHVANRLLAATTLDEFRMDHKNLVAMVEQELAEFQVTGTPENARKLSRIGLMKLDLDALGERMASIERDKTSFLYKLAKLSAAEQLVEIYEKLIEPTLIDPTFVTHVPSVIIPLARKNAEDPFFADVYELAINGVEISPGYSELNDPDVQEENFKHQVGDEAERQKTDEDFLTALKYGMPPAGGMGMGVDRLLMMLTGAESIRDVILFPLMKPQG